VSAIWRNYSLKSGVSAFSSHGAIVIAGEQGNWGRAEKCVMLSSVIDECKQE